MKSSISISLLLVCGSAAAQYKCVDAKGQTTFQQSPCAASEKEQKVRVFPGEASKASTTPASAPQAQIGPYQRMVANMERGRKAEQTAQTIDDLERQVNHLQDVIARRNNQMAVELNALQHKKSYSKNNLAGATWEQSISTEMQAVTQKYKAMNDADFERLRQLRSELESAKIAKK